MLWSPRSVSVWQYVKLTEVSVETRPRDSLNDDEDFEKPTKQNDDLDSKICHTNSSFYQKKKKERKKSDQSIPTPQNLDMRVKDCSQYTVIESLAFHG